MKALYNLLWTCLMILGVSSCVSEFSDGGGEVPVVEAKGILHVPMTRGDNVQDSIIKSRMIVFKANGNFVLNTDQPKNPAPYTDPNHPTFVEIVPTGSLNVYLIANERSSWRLDTIKTEATLRNVRYEYYSQNATQLPEADATWPIPMFGIHRNVFVDESGNTSIDLTSPNPPADPYPVTVKRIFAKVTLYLICQFSDQNNGGTPLVLDTLKLRRIPSYSWLYATPYSGDSLWLPERFTGEFHDALAPFYPNISLVSGWPMSNYEKDAYKFQDTVSFFIPEYLPNDTSLYTYLSIRVNVENQPDVAKTYRLILGEGLKHGSKFMSGDSILPNGHRRDIYDLSIQRNTHYIITAMIKNFGLTGKEDLDVYLKVANWEEVGLGPEDIDNYTLNISQGEFHVTKGETAVVRIETNHREGWRATVSGDLELRDGTGYASSLQRQDSGPLEFRVKTTATSGSHYIDIIVGKITKRIKVTVS
ncbi:MAG: hypothetical protein LBC19_13940 [Tannerella sp.]|jgi:hypothetical protein|nr:hypothetical protein [Tannerella sp.]